MSKSGTPSGQSGSVSVSIDKNGSLDMPQYAAQQIVDRRQNAADTRQNAVSSGALPEDAFVDMDNATSGPFREVTKLWAYCQQRGLTRQVDINSELVSWQVRDDSGRGSVDMDLETEADELSLEFGYDAAAMPVIHVNYSVGFREGVSPGAPVQPEQSIETMKTSTAGRVVGETAEQVILGNPGGTGPADHVQVNWRGNPVGVSSLTDPERVNTTTLGADWETDLSQIRKSFKNLRSILKHDNNVSAGNTGYDVFLGETYFDLLDSPDPDGNGNMYVRDRVEDLSNINMIDELDYLPEKSVLMLRPTTDVFELGVGQNPQTTQWTVNPWRDYWKTHAALAPMPKVTLNSNQSGIVYAEAP